MCEHTQRIVNKVISDRARRDTRDDDVESTSKIAHIAQDCEHMHTVNIFNTHMCVRALELM